MSDYDYKIKGSEREKKVTKRQHASERRGNKTLKALSAEYSERAQEKRASMAKKSILNVIGKFPEFDSKEQEDKFLEDYRTWIISCIEKSKILIDKEKDFKFRFQRSSKKAGGQNVNKVESSATAIHNKTNIWARNDETRDQLKNKNAAIKEVAKLIEEHLKDWIVYLNKRNPETISKDEILELVIEQLESKIQ
jgi:hypothetical protein